MTQSVRLDELIKLLRPEFQKSISAGSKILGRLFVGRTDGPRVGLYWKTKVTPENGGFEAVDEHNVPFMNVWISDIPNQADPPVRLRIGYVDRPGIEMGWLDGDTHPHPQILVDAACITGIIGRVGATGWFITVDGKRADVVNGLITSLTTYIMGANLLRERPHRSDPQRSWPLGPQAAFGTHHLLSGLTPANDHPHYADADSGIDGGTF